MASAQVLPSSAASARKQEHLEAGKRRLEEFRKKKAAERAKKAPPSTQVHKPDASLNEKQLSETEHVRASVLDGVSTSDGVGGAVIHTSAAVTTNDQSPNLFTQSSDGDYLVGRTSPARNDLNTSTGLVETRGDVDEVKRYNVSGYAGPVDVNQYESNKVNNTYGIHGGGLGGVTHGTTNDETTHLHSQLSQEFDGNTSQSSFLQMNETQFNKSNSSLKDYTVSDHGSSYFPSKISPQNSLDSHLQIKPTNSNTLDGGYSYGPFNGGSSDSFSPAMRKTITSSDNELPNLLGATMQKFDSLSSDARHSPNHVPIYAGSTESNSRRSRPSFLDSLNVPRPSSGSPFQQIQHDNNSSLSNHLESNSFDISGSTHLQKPSVDTKPISPSSNFTTPNVHSALGHSTNSVSNSNSQEMLKIIANENMEKNHGFYSSTQNEDFSALEQHIEDLTQEKFSLQRALDASRALAESLAAENSSITDSYNQQRSVVNQLKSDMEMLQKEIKVQMVELEAVRSEYTNVQLECNAADERAKLLASEVIGLEEKALKLRSNELKLEKQLENAEAEISSYRRKMSSLEKDRHDLQSTINALQEEKKLFQSKLRKASGMGKSIEDPNNKRDASTSTEDIASEDTPANSSNQEMNDSASGHDANALSSANIPHDQMRMIENINALISELALEKEELMKALTSESSECSKLKELNKDLTRKLEDQTQRLEFLTARSMSNVNIPVKQPDSNTDNIYEDAQYADEGDEVVERVLGWIMKLFPGGPSKRRTSKLL
ncbi:hypothetical protein L6164_016465 [Bauhinia variegata]|uniref:Uncharacterized protein n=1 Tax=Bauhinia variegata TaxID=167791 RepID=A0ACB9NPL7_BAUVA|nr:hypothetical protein L6164_016465 [Bauhinia variegata]